MVPCPELPLELISEILNYLDLSDRLVASQTCKLWYEASLDSKMHCDSVLVIHNYLSEAAEVLSESDKPYPSVILKELELNISSPSHDLSKLWTAIGDAIRRLEIHDCFLTDRSIVDLLLKTPNLQHLKISGCRELMMSGKLFANWDSSETQQLLKQFRNLRGLSLENNRYLSDAIYTRFARMTPALQHLSLNGCQQVSFHPGVYRRFYPNGESAQPSESVFTFKVILDHVTQIAAHLTSLNLSNSLLNSQGLTHIIQIPGLRLLNLEMRGCDQLTKAGILALCQHQPQLVKLDLSCCSRITDPALMAICHNLTHLERLSVQRCRALTDQGIAHIKYLTRLRHLDFSSLSEIVTSQGIQEALVNQDRQILTTLNLSFSNCDDATVSRICCAAPHLLDLDLSYCLHAVTDVSIQVICRKLKRLRRLSLAWCKHVSDVGLTGHGLDFDSLQSTPTTFPCTPKEIEQAEEAINSLLLAYQREDEGVSIPVPPPPPSRETPNYRISLRSRAEEEIYQDAQRKSYVQHKLTADFEIGAHTLADLKNLRYLNLAGCSRITNLSLRHVLHFPGLQHVDLSHCQQISDEGLEWFAQQNPSLEIVNLCECHMLTDRGISAIISSLKRLKHLDLTNCSNLTDLCVAEIADKCKALRYLNLSCCNKISQEAAESLEDLLPQLRTLERRGLKSIYGLSPSPTQTCRSPFSSSNATKTSRIGKWISKLRK